MCFKIVFTNFANFSTSRLHERQQFPRRNQILVTVVLLPHSAPEAPNQFSHFPGPHQANPQQTKDARHAGLLENAARPRLGKRSSPCAPGKFLRRNRHRKGTSTLCSYINIGKFASQRDNHIKHRVGEFRMRPFSLMHPAGCFSRRTAGSNTSRRAVLLRCCFQSKLLLALKRVLCSNSPGTDSGCWKNSAKAPSAW